MKTGHTHRSGADPGRCVITEVVEAPLNTERHRNNMTTTVIDDRACAAALIVAGCRLVKAYYSPDRSTKDLFEFERSDSMVRAYEAWRRYELAGSMRRYANVLRDLTRQRIVGDAIHG